MYKKAFTLIELLVVVLIIGILAAVALAQYQKTVRKTKVLQYEMWTDAVFDSYQRYLLENAIVEEKTPIASVGIDMDFPFKTGEGCRVYSDGAYCYNADSEITTHKLFPNSQAYISYGNNKYSLLCASSVDSGRAACLAAGYVKIEGKDNYYGKKPS